MAHHESLVLAALLLPAASSFSSLARPVPSFHPKIAHVPSAYHLPAFRLSMNAKIIDSQTPKGNAALFMSSATKAIQSVARAGMAIAFFPTLLVVGALCGAGVGALIMYLPTVQYGRFASLTAAAIANTGSAVAADSAILWSIISSLLAPLPLALKQSLVSVVTCTADALLFLAQGASHLLVNAARAGQSAALVAFGAIASGASGSGGALSTLLPLLRDASVDLFLGGADGVRSLFAFLAAAAIAASSAITTAAVCGASAASAAATSGAGAISSGVAGAATALGAALSSAAAASRSAAGAAGTAANTAGGAAAGAAGSAAASAGKASVAVGSAGSATGSAIGGAAAVASSSAATMAASAAASVVALASAFAAFAMSAASATASATSLAFASVLGAVAALLVALAQLLSRGVQGSVVLCGGFAGLCASTYAAATAALASLSQGLGSSVAGTAQTAVGAAQQAAGAASSAASTAASSAATSAATTAAASSSISSSLAERISSTLAQLIGRLSPLMDIPAATLASLSSLDLMPRAARMGRLALVIGLCAAVVILPIALGLWLFEQAEIWWVYFRREMEYGLGYAIRSTLEAIVQWVRMEGERTQNYRRSRLPPDLFDTLPPRKGDGVRPAYPRSQPVVVPNAPPAAESWSPKPSWKAVAASYRAKQGLGQQQGSPPLPPQLQSQIRDLANQVVPPPDVDQSVSEAMPDPVDPKVVIFLDQWQRMRDDQERRGRG